MSILVLLVIGGLIVGCASPGPRRSRDDLSRSLDPSFQAGAPDGRTPKQITIVVPTEVNALVTQLEAIGPASFAAKSMHEFFNAYLAAPNQQDEIQPWLATELPTLDQGTIRLLEGGTMETTWHLRREARWHDGTPFSAHDVVFGWQVQSHSSWPVRSGQARAIQDIATPDPHTLVMTWKAPNMFAAQLIRIHLDPLPRHRLEADWRADPGALPNHPYFTSVDAFVGTGPYRPIQWSKGSHLTAQAFDDYFLGRPRIDRITFRAIADPRTALANLLAGQVDIINGALSYEDAIVVQREWAKTNGGTILLAPNFMRHLLPQFRLEHASPRDLATDVRVRKALLHALNRPEISEVVSPGSGPSFVADSYAVPDTPWGRAAERVVPKYAFDRVRALQLFEDAGWRRASDGALTKNGERFELEMRTGRIAEVDQVYALLQQDWKAVGVTLTSLDFSSAPNPVDYALYPGIVFSTQPANSDTYYTRYQSTTVASPQNRYSGSNGSGYINPAYDSAVEDLLRSIRPGEIARGYAETQRVLFEDLGALPLYFTSNPLLVRSGISGVTPTSPLGSATFAPHTWDVR